MKLYTIAGLFVPSTLCCTALSVARNGGRVHHGRRGVGRFKCTRVLAHGLVARGVAAPGRRVRSSRAAYGSSECAPEAGAIFRNEISQIELTSNSMRV